MAKTRAGTGTGKKKRKKGGGRSCPPGCKCKRHKENQDPKPEDGQVKRQSRTEAGQAEFLTALRFNMGIIQPALDAVGISRTTYRRWYNNDPDFQERFDDVIQEQREFVEGQLLKKIHSGDSDAIKFYLDRRHPAFMDPNKSNQIPGQKLPPPLVKLVPAGKSKTAINE